MTSTIYLPHQFFEDAFHPDLQELERRDRFLESIKHELHIHMENSDIVAEIPDVDIDTLYSVTK